MGKGDINDLTFNVKMEYSNQEIEKCTTSSQLMNAEQPISILNYFNSIEISDPSLGKFRFVHYTYDDNF